MNPQNGYGYSKHYSTGRGKGETCYRDAILIDNCSNNDVAPAISSLTLKALTLYRKNSGKGLGDMGGRSSHDHNLHCIILVCDIY